MKISYKGKDCYVILMYPVHAFASLTLYIMIEKHCICIFLVFQLMDWNINYLLITHTLSSWFKKESTALDF